MYRIPFIRHGLVVLALLSTLGAHAAEPLPALNIDIAETSISGISSGGFMTVQFQVAHSAIIKGAGVVAGGPYYCSQDDVMKAVAQCSCTGEPSVACKVTDSSADVPGLATLTREMAAAHKIDPVQNLADDRVITFSGDKDTLVPSKIAQQLSTYYTAVGVAPANLSAVKLPQAAHTMPTRDYGIACDKENEPYIGKCDYDAAGAVLKWVYGDLKAPVAKPRGQFIRFDQAAYVPRDTVSSYLWGTGMDSTGWVYVPQSCARGEPCRLHIALHGCKQGQSYLPLKPPPGGGLYNGTTFVKNVGYDRWADSNHIVVLYPQAVSVPMLNPNGCWDWWGYTGEDYANQKGVQIRAIKAMVDRLGSGRG